MVVWSLLLSLYEKLYETNSLSAGRVEESLGVVGDSMSQRELETVLNYCGLFLKTQQLAQVVRHLKKDEFGQLYKDEVVAHLIPAMNARRSACADRAFDSLGGGGGDEVSTDALWDKMDLSGHLAVRTGGPEQLSAVEAHFRSAFDAATGGSGVLTRAAFRRVVTGMSAAVVTDGIFVDTLLKMFGIEEADATDDDRLAPLVACLKEKVRQKLMRNTMHPACLLQTKMKHYADFSAERPGKVSFSEFWDAMEFFGVVQDEKVFGRESMQDESVRASMLSLFDKGPSDGERINISEFVRYIYPDYAALA